MLLGQSLHIKGMITSHYGLAMINTMEDYMILVTILLVLLFICKIIVLLRLNRQITQKEYSGHQAVVTCTPEGGCHYTWREAMIDAYF